jgi:ABC-type dipeptide/oligopeptide/nickel transport system ATPase component
MLPRGGEALAWLVAPVEHQVLEHGHAGEPACDLEGAGETGTAKALRTPARHLGAGKAHAARLRPQSAGDRVEERRLSGAVRADEARDPALLDGESRAVERRDPSEVHPQLVDLQEGHAGEPSKSAAVLRSRRVREAEEQLRERAIAVARRLDLLQVGDSPAQDISGGQKKLLELGRVLMAHPKLILLDEPAAGVNPTLARGLAAHIRELRSQGLTFLIIEHNMGLVAELCEHVVVLTNGKRLAEGSFAEIRSDPRVQAAYMGGRA